MEISQTVACPQCGSSRVYRDGLRYLSNGEHVQRFRCRNCWYRFTERHNGSKRSFTTITIGEYALSYAKNSPLACQMLEEQKANGSEKAGVSSDVKGKIVTFLWTLKRSAYSEYTIRSYEKCLCYLLKFGANLSDGESVKDVIASQKQWSIATKKIVSDCYHKFALINHIAYEPPRYRPSQKLPFIPLESEIDTLVSACGNKTSTILQLLKETGLRIGEASRLQWTDVDSERNTITMNHPEKNGKSRMFKVSEKLIAMLNKLPKKTSKVFGEVSVASLQVNFDRQRKRISAKLQNPRLLRITFHTLRHWKATMEYHKTKDILHVMQMLGHRNIQNTLIYTSLVKFEEEDAYYSATAKTIEEAKALIESGFEYVLTNNDVMLFRKRK